ncbi:hypothetical protein [Neorhizobium sp. R1-B]|uniref:hypothetical protein n=1 Tax=Neorhizobium sp. R1-B TaxID=2485162 RepID=UPI0010663D35|nr:hypothetical protein [Neorhizobium sp. R1-B]
MDGAVEKLKRERNENMVLAWHIEALARQEKLPKLEKLLSKGKAPKAKPQSSSWESDFASVSAWFSSRK